MRNIEKEINFVKTKLAETEKSYQKEQRSLGELSDRSVKLIADNIIKPTGQREKAIKEVADQIKELKDKIELTPRILEALKNKISLLENEKAELILQGKIEKQKKYLDKLEEVSKSFIKNLKSVIEQNREIRGLWSNFNSLKEETKYNKFDGRRVSMYSEEGLELICGILLGEYQGIPRKQSIISRIKI